MVLSILVFPLWRARRSLMGLVREGIYILMGVAGATLALAPVSRILLGYWAFFMRQINLALYEVGTPGVLTGMWGSGDGFLLTAFHLFPVAFVLLFGLVLLTVVPKVSAVAWPGYLALLTCSLIYSIQEFVLHGVVLHVPYHSVYLVVPQFVMAGVIFGELWRNSESPRIWIASTLLVLFAIVLPWAVKEYRDDLFSPGLWGRIFVVAAVALVLLVGWRSAPSAFRVAIGLLLLLLLFIGPARESFLYKSDALANRRDFQALMSFNEVLKASLPLEQQVAFWVDPGERDYELFISAQALWVFGGYDFSHALQGPVPGDIRDRLSASTTLVHLTDHSEKIGERLKLLDTHGIRYANPRQWTVRYGQSEFYLAAEEITDISAMR